MPTATIAWNSGDPTFNPAGPFQLQPNQAVIIALGPEFPETAIITNVTVKTAQTGGNDLTPAWSTAPIIAKEGTKEVYKIGANSIMIEDLQVLSSGTEDFWIQVQLEVLGQTYTVDPELVNNPGG